jgi:hypothetical protein
MELLVEFYLAEKAEILGLNLPQCQLVRNKSHMTVLSRSHITSLLARTYRLLIFVLHKSQGISLPTKHLQHSQIRVV